MRLRLEFNIFGYQLIYKSVSLPRRSDFDIRSINNGDSGAFAYLFREYYKVLCLYAGRIIGSEESEDLVGDVFLRLYRHHEPFKDEDHIKAYLYRSVKNACLDKIKVSERAKNRHEQFVAEHGTITESYLFEITQSEVIRQLYFAINTLPEQCRKVISMAYIEGLSNPEVAEKLGVSVHTVKNQKLRGLALLRHRIPKDAYTILALYPYFHLLSNLKK